MQYAYEDDPGKWSAVLLAVLMHALLALALVVGVRWQTRPVPVVAEIWVAAPEPVAAAPEVPAAIEPPPPPRKAAPAPEPEVAPPPKPDIKLKAPLPKKPKVETKVEKAPAPPSFDDLLAREESQLDRRKLEQDKLRRAEEEARLLAQAQADQEAQKRAAAQGRARADYQSKLRGKIRGNLVQPPNLKGNPVVQFTVAQLPSGEIIDVRLKRASSNQLYDAAVERAILKSSPLPKPDDASVFSRELDLTFCPDEERGCR
jgi:colicin import membrane protein